MRRGIVPAIALLLAGCNSPGAGDSGGRTAGDRLEAAAIARGLVIDAGARDIVGAWAHETDRMCIVPGGEGAAGSDILQIGLLIDYGAGSGCAASGTAVRRGNALDLSLGGCRISARFVSDRLSLPAEVPAACDRFCAGHATLAAMSVEQQSASASEAHSLRAPSGRLLCPT